MTGMDHALVRADVRDLPAMEAGLDGGYDAIVHLAARAGSVQSAGASQPGLVRPRDRR